MPDYKALSPDEAYVIIHKGTERPGTGKFLTHTADGTYVCRQCDAPLYRSSDKFDSGCGWPAFDDEIPGAVKRTVDADGRRIEITCANCGGHLGHVFEGERLTSKNVRHCVNSLSLDFKPKKDAIAQPLESVAYFAGGCFWGVESLFKKQPGVTATSVGYMGGGTENPSYKDVCRGDTGHAEVLRVTFDASRVSYAELCRLFFEIHDFTQVNRQGPDIGRQYRSEIFTADEKQAETADKILDELVKKGYEPATKVTPAADLQFWAAEDYHQDYYGKTGKVPYCHTRKRIF